MEALLRQLVQVKGWTYIPQSPSGQPRVPRQPGQFADDVKQPDTAETVHISALALLKMLKHCRSGIPLESVSVESVDPVFQTNMLEMLKSVHRPEMVVGWYHSHPGFGCFLSGVDVRTQQAFEALHERAVAVVVDPLQSVKGKVVMDAFRTIDPGALVMSHMSGRFLGESRTVTSNVGHVRDPNLTAMANNLNKQYYSLVINASCRNQFEYKMLMSLGKANWTTNLEMTPTSKMQPQNLGNMHKLLKLVKQYHKDIEEEQNLTADQIELRKVGRENPRRHINELAGCMLNENVLQSLLISVQAVAHSKKKVLSAGPLPSAKCSPPK